MCMQIGGNSLQTGSVCSRVRSALGLHANIPAAWLFVHQTIRTLAAKIAQDIMAPGAVHVAPLLPTVSKLLAHPAEGIQTPTQLSFQQARICSAMRCLISQGVVLHVSQPGPQGTCFTAKLEACVACRSNSCSCGSRTLPARPTTPPGASASKAAWTWPHCRRLCGCWLLDTWCARGLLSLCGPMSLANTVEACMVPAALLTVDVVWCRCYGRALWQQLTVRSRYCYQ